MSQCPYCRSKIDLYATTCKYCRRSFKLGFFVKLTRFVIRAVTVFVVFLIAVIVFLAPSDDENNSQDDISTTFQRNGLPTTFESTADSVIDDDEGTTDSVIDDDDVLSSNKPAIENIKIDTSEDSEELRTRKKTLYANFKSLIKEETLKNIVIPSQIKTNFKTGVEVSYWQNGKIRSYVIVKKSKSNIWDKSVRDALQSLGSYSSSIDNIILTNNIVFINFDIDPKTVYDFNASNR